MGLDKEKDQHKKVKTGEEKERKNNWKKLENIKWKNKSVEIRTRVRAVRVHTNSFRSQA